LLLAFSIFLEKKEKRIFLPKKCIVFEEKYVFFGITVDFPQGIKTIFVFYFFSWKLRGPTATLFLPCPPSQKEHIFLGKQCIFLAKKFVYLFFAFFLAKKSVFLCFFKKIERANNNAIPPIFFGKKIAGDIFLDCW